MRLETWALLISFAIAVILGIIIIPILKRLKVGQIERDDGPKSHLKKQGTPTMGGIIMIITMILIVTGLYIFLSVNGQNEVANKILPILLLTLGFGLIGYIDDFKKLVLKNTDGLKPMYKMLGLLIISVAYVLYLVYGLHLGTKTYIPIWNNYIELPIYLYIPFAIIVILGTTNAVNLTDGIDGLASSVSAIIITALSIVGIKLNVPEISVFGSSVIGAVLGFLMFNLHPVVPVLETLSVIIQVAYYKKTGKRIFKMAPLHHHFELSGWKENKVVIVFSLVTLILCVIGLKII